MSNSEPISKFCKQCHYSLDQLTESRCPECGQEFDPNDETTYLTSLKMNWRWETILSPCFLIASFVLPWMLRDFFWKINHVNFGHGLQVILVTLGFFMGISGFRHSRDITRWFGLFFAIPNLFFMLLWLSVALAIRLGLI